MSLSDNSRGKPGRVQWAMPMSFVFLAGILIPVEIRPAASGSFSFSFGVSDFVSNVLGFLPLGVLLGNLELKWVACFSALISFAAETSQLMMMFRSPDLTDVLTNVLGAVLGAVIHRRWQVGRKYLSITPTRIWLAAVTALLLTAAIWATTGPPLNFRGVSEPGIMEAQYSFDEPDGLSALDASGHGHTGAMRGGPKHVAGVLGSAIRFIDPEDFIRIPMSTGLRLAGDMTLTAWINPASFPWDDGAIVSNLDDSGFQLDTTKDRGPRTIGFKLTDRWGGLMARYGSTPLVVNTWQHVAGVYHAASRSMHVYLDGQLDDGALLGTVTDRQRSSRQDVLIGQRPVRESYPFKGAIDEVRIYSAALTQLQVQAVLRGEGVVLDANTSPSSTERPVGLLKKLMNPGIEVALRASDPEDARIPPMAAALGALLALACSRFRTKLRIASSMVFSLAGGLVIVLLMSFHLPAFNGWLIPLTCMTGSVSVLVSAKDGTHRKAAILSIMDENESATFDS